MKIKTQDLTHAALDWAVCKASGLVDAYPKHRSGKFFLSVRNQRTNGPLRPSTDWSQGGPIIEREEITLDIHDPTKEWRCFAYKHDNDELIGGTGPTPLIAAMRCYVASKLGYEIDVPEELTC